MYQQQPRMAAGNGANAAAAAQFQQANQATSGVNAQFPASYNNQVSNYQPQQQWNNGGGGGASGGGGAFSGQNFPGYNNPDHAGFNQQPQWSNHQQNGGNNWNPAQNPWQNNNNNQQNTAAPPVVPSQPPTTAQQQPPTVQKQNLAVSGQAQPPCDSNYQRTFDYVQQCQNWTAQ